MSVSKGFVVGKFFSRRLALASLKSHTHASPPSVSQTSTSRANQPRGLCCEASNRQGGKGRRRRRISLRPYPLRLTRSVMSASGSGSGGDSAPEGTFLRRRKPPIAIATFSFNISFSERICGKFPATLVVFLGLWARWWLRVVTLRRLRYGCPERRSTRAPIAARTTWTICTRPY